MGPEFINRGIGSNITSQMLGRLDSLKCAKKIFIEAGVNDFILIKRPVTDVFNNYCQIITELGKDKCVVQSLLPVGQGYAIYLDSVKKLNVLLQDYCRVNNVDYLDIHSLVKNMDEDNSVDGCHPNGKVYKIWAEALIKYLQKYQPANLTPPFHPKKKSLEIY